jgi:hypothetical protein
MISEVAIFNYLASLQVLVSVFPYDEAAKLCGGALPSYISQVSHVLLLQEFVFLVLNARSRNIVDSSCLFGRLLVHIIPFNPLPKIIEILAWFHTTLSVP